MFPESKQYSSEKQRLRRLKEPDETVSPGFTEDTAKKSNLTQRQIQNYIRIAESLPEDVKDAVKKLDLPMSELSFTVSHHKPILKQGMIPLWVNIKKWL